MNRLYLTLLCFAAFAPVAHSQNETFSTIPVDKLSAAQVTDTTSGPMPEVWTYSDCVDWACANSSDLRRNILSVLQADQAISQAKDAWLPTVSFGMNHSFTNYPSARDGIRANSYGSNYGIDAQWTAWEGNIRKYRTESARLALRQQQLAGDNTIITIRLGILQAYLDVLYAAETVEIARQTLEVSTSQADRALKLTESGRTSRVDYAQIESQRAQDAYNLTQAESSYANAKLNLKKILEIRLDQDINVADVKFADSEVESPLLPMTEVYDIAASWLPEFKSNALNKDIYETDVKIAKAGRMPQISVSGSLGTGYSSGVGSWTSQMGHNFNEGVGVNFSVPIYDANQTKRKVTEAKLNALNYELEREDLFDDLSNTIENLYIEARNARAKYESGKVQLESTQLTADLVNRQFELGLVNPLELLTAHNNLLNARLELLQCKYMAILSNKTINFYATQQITLP